MKMPKISFSFAAMICILAWLNWSLCLSFLLSALIHELGHLAAMKLWRVPIEAMSIGAAGAKIRTGAMNHKQEIRCALAGPLTGIVFALCILRILPQTAVVSFLLSLINLLPLYPLDGGRVLRACLSLYFEEAKVRKITHIVTVVICSTLMIVACWASICMRWGLWPMLAALVLLCRVGDME